MNKKIGILTFHWGTNYGGVLQAYALQSFLKKMGYDVVIIDYKILTHRNSFFRCFRSRSLREVKKKLAEYYKELKFVPFRDNYLNLTEPLLTLKELKNGTKEIDVFICGSDQIWKPNIALGHGNVYFLPFVGEDKKKISYAVSLGTTDYPKKIFEKIQPLLNQFDHISVREKTAIEILKQNGIEKVELMPDPALLFDTSDLTFLKTNKRKSTLPENSIFFYILQENQTLINTIKKYLSMNNVVNETKTGRNAYSIKDWVASFPKSKFVVTNSFHGVVFALLYHKNFIAVPIEGCLSGMNDRIYTLLEQFNLQDRIVEKYSELNIQNLIQKDISWEDVDTIRMKLKDIAYNYLSQSINQ